VIDRDETKVDPAARRLAICSTRPTLVRLASAAIAVNMGARVAPDDRCAKPVRAPRTSSGRLPRQ
jgi:hypothetical protein